MTKYTAKQPRHGDTILHCGHLDASKWEWFHFEEPNLFKRPDGTEGTAQWLFLCMPCVIESQEKGSPQVSADGIWRGNAPVIKDVSG